jgi:hypothetical protein
MQVGAEVVSTTHESLLVRQVAHSGTVAATYCSASKGVLPKWPTEL